MMGNAATPLVSPRPRDNETKFYYMAEFFTALVWVAALLALTIYAAVRVSKNKDSLNKIETDLNVVWPSEAWECRNPGPIPSIQQQMRFKGMQVTLADNVRDTQIFDPALRAPCMTCRSEDSSHFSTYPILETYMPRDVFAEDVSAGGVFTRDGRITTGGFFNTASAPLISDRCGSSNFNSFYVVFRDASSTVHVCYCRQVAGGSIGVESCSDGLLRDGDVALNCVGGDGSASDTCADCDPGTEGQLC